MKKHKCCFAGCKYKHLSLFCILDHMFKEHNLRINGKRVWVKSMTADLKINDANVLEDDA